MSEELITVAGVQVVKAAWEALSGDERKQAEQSFAAHTGSELPESFSGKPKRGRPRSETLETLAGMHPEVSRRGLNDIRSATWAFSVIGSQGSEDVKAFLIDDKTLKRTLLAALGRLRIPTEIMLAADVITERRMNARQGKALIRHMRNKERSLLSFELAVLRVCDDYQRDLNMPVVAASLRHLANVLEDAHRDGKL